MREILFRGKTDKGEWVHGDLLHPDLYGNGYAIEDFTKGKNNCCDVLPKTIGQYTGLTDKNGKKIFEGDILEFSDRLVIVFWHTHLGCWDSNFLKFTNKDNSRDDMSPLNWEYKSNVVGNIHDNPEFMKGGEG